MKKTIIFISVFAVLIVGVVLLNILVPKQGMESSIKKSKTSDEVAMESEEPKDEKANGSLKQTETIFGSKAQIDGKQVNCVSYSSTSTTIGSSKIVIPAECDGVKGKVVMISSPCLDENEPVVYMKEIVIEEGPEELTTDFYMCTNLTSVTLPASLEKISDDAFEYCKDKVTLYVIKGSYAEKYAKKYKLKYEYQ